MKLQPYLVPLGFLLLAGCSTAKPDKGAFYTPKNWKEPIQASDSNGSSKPFFPDHRNYGNSPKVDPMSPMEAGNDFVPDFGGDGADSASAEEDFTPSFGGSGSQKSVGKMTEQMVGVGSWYGPGFHGKETANGEKYNQRGMTAAHKILPMDTWVRVTNQENGKSVVVRINDRGPYVDDRIIDLTETAAKKLGYADQGTANVKLTVVRYPKGYDASKGLTPYKQVVVQVAVFKDQDKARSFKRSLASRYGGIPFLVDPKEGSFHVVAGPFEEREQAGRVSSSLKGEGVNNFVRSFRK